MRFQAKNLKPILDENWAMIAERDGEVLGAALSLPDINQVLAKMNGRLLPFGWLRFLTGRAKIDRIRVFALGVKPRYQHLGVAAALYVRHIEVAARVRQKWGEMGWILEVNEPMNRAMEGMGGTVTKRYRLYELPLSAPRASQTARFVAGSRRRPAIDCRPCRRKSCSRPRRSRSPPPTMAWTWRSPAGSPSRRAARRSRPGEAR